MRKIIMMLLVLAMTVCGAVGIAACGKDPEPEQNQGQVEQNKDKDKEENKPNQNQGEINKGEEEKEDGKGETGSENPTKPGEKDPPVTPEPQKPNPETPPQDEEEKEEDKKEEDKKDEGNQDEDKDDGKEEEPPQGDDPGTEPDEGKTDPEPDNPTKPDDKEPEGKDPEEDKKPEETKPDPKPQTPSEQDTCQHNYVYEVVGEDPNTRQHVGVCSKCKKRVVEKCDFTDGFTTVPASCTKPEHKLYVCKVCKNSLEATIWEMGRVKTPATGHKFTGTCTYVSGSSPSQHAIQCENPGCTETKKENCVFESELKQPTCTEPGFTSRTCKTCGHKETISGESEALGHQWVYTVNKGAETHTKHCIRPCCNKNEEITEPCTIKTEENRPNCTQKGSTILLCEVCGRRDVTEIEATGHSLQSGAELTYTKHKGKCEICGVEVDEDHHYGRNNFCLTCKFDGIFANSYYMNRLSFFELGESSKNFMKKLKEAVLVEYPWGKDHPVPLTQISVNAFKGCSNLEDLYIPKTVTTIAQGAFKDCSNLKTIYFAGTDDQWKKLGVSDLGRAQVVVNKTYGEEETKTNTVSAVQQFALPAGENKRLYA